MCRKPRLLNRPFLGSLLFVVFPFALAACGGSSASVGGGGSGGGNGGNGENPVPSISSLSPTSAVTGSAAFTLTVAGTNFISDSTVDWNGSPRSTSFLSSTELQAQILASDIAAVGSASVTVINPAPGGGTSNTLTFMTNSGGVTVLVVNQLSNDLAWDQTNQMIYLSVPSTAGANGNTITALNPASAEIVSSVFAGSEPDSLAISGDNQFVYAGLDGSAAVQRFVLPSLTKDINYSLGTNAIFGPYFALDLQVAPGAPHTTAVTLGNVGVSPSAEGGIVIFDDATPRAITAPGFSTSGNLYDSLQWGSDATALYAANNEDTAFDFYNLTVSASGVVLDNDYRGVFSDFEIRIHYDGGTGLIYSDDGHIVNPSTGLPAGEFAASGVMIPDSTLNSAFFLGQTEAQAGTNSYTIVSFNLTQFTQVNSIVIPNVSGTPLRLIRWGANGLAFNSTDEPLSNGGAVYLISGAFVNSGQPQNTRAVPNSERVRRTWQTPKKRSLPDQNRPPAS